MPVTFSTTDIVNGLTFSNGNRTVAAAVDGVGAWTRSTHGSTAPFYVEFIYENTNHEYGITNGTQDISTLGDIEPNKGIAIYTNTSHWFWYSDNIPEYGQFSTGIGTAGDRLCVACDPVNGRIWARLNSGNWNNSGAANPTTNVGGINISDFGSKLYVVAKSNYTYAPATAYFATADWTVGAPSGFTEIPDIRRRVITVG